MDLSAHMQKVKQSSMKKSKNFINNGSIWYNWKDGDQIIRFVGDFFSTRIHYIGTNSQQTNLNLFPDESFSGDDKIPKVINCANWDSDSEKRIDGGCVICKLNSIARSVCRSSDFSNMDKKEQTKYQGLKLRTDDRSSFKWNIIDRSDSENKGFKIATLGQELFDALVSIHEDYSPSIFTDESDGIDIKVSKNGGSGKERVKYSARVVMENNKLKVTPLTDEEKSWQMHNLMEMCGKKVDNDLVHAKLLDEWQDILSSFDDNGQMEEVNQDDGGDDDVGDEEEQSGDDAPF